MTPCQRIATKNAIAPFPRGFNRCQALALDSMPTSVLRALVLWQMASERGAQSELEDFLRGST
jgi:hypothetical protein